MKAAVATFAALAGGYALERYSSRKSKTYAFDERLREEQRQGVKALQQHSGQTNWTFTPEGRRAAIRASMMTIPAAVTARGLHATLKWVHSHRPEWYRRHAHLVAGAALLALSQVSPVTATTMGFAGGMLVAAEHNAPAIDRRSECGGRQEWDSRLDGALPSVEALRKDFVRSPERMRLALLKRFPHALETLFTDQDTGRPRNPDLVLALIRRMRTLALGSDCK